ncbi:MAG: hypothetical protein KC466_20155, partial [Myxococcales bacterium]|nr:hypothetical protein [Myxococcales bacterium]
RRIAYDLDFGGIATQEAEGERIAAALAERYAGDLRDGERFEVTGDLGDEFAFARVSFRNREGTDCLEVESRVSLEANDIAMPHDGFDAAIDLIDIFFMEYFEDDRAVRIHGTWKVYEQDGYEVELRGRRRNLVAEAATEEFLRKNHRG